MLLVSALKTRKRQVYDPKGIYLGRVVGFRLDLEKGLVEEVLVQHRGFPWVSVQRVAIGVIAVKYFTPVVQTLGTLAKLGLDYSRKKIGQREYLSYRVVTKSGMVLGEVYDYLFDPATLKVTQFEVMPDLWRHARLSSFLISWKDVLDVRGKTLVVRDAVAKESVLEHLLSWQRKKHREYAFGCIPGGKE